MYGITDRPSPAEREPWTPSPEPSTFHVGVNFALAVLSAAALAVQQALGAGGDGADAAVLDMKNKEVIGYEVSRNIDSELCKRALSNALALRGKHEGLIFHSDRGSQYSSRAYKRMLQENGIEGSMSAPGCPYDNSCVESFFATLKKELIFRRKYATIEEVKTDLYRYIELFYNRKRLHSTLGYMSPVAYRLAFMQ